jgi:hypothetical protein
MGMVRDGIDNLRDLHYAVDGQIFNKTTGNFEAGTAATQTAAQLAINDSVKAIVEMLPALTFLGVTIPKTSVETAVNKIVAALKIYFNVTTKV